MVVVMLVYDTSRVPQITRMKNAICEIEWQNKTKQSPNTQTLMVLLNQMLKIFFIFYLVWGLGMLDAFVSRYFSDGYSW